MFIQFVVAVAPEHAPLVERVLGAERGKRKKEVATRLVQVLQAYERYQEEAKRRQAEPPRFHADAQLADLLTQRVDALGRQVDYVRGLVDGQLKGFATPLEDLQQAINMLRAVKPDPE